MAGSARRAVAGAVLLDISVGPLFLWDAFSAPLSRELDASTTALSLAFSVGLAAFTMGVLLGGRLADAVAPRRLALVTAAGVGVGLGMTAVAPSLPVLVVGFGIVLGGTSGIGYATAVRVASTVATKRGRAVALVVSAYAASAVILAPVVDILLDRVGRAGMFTVLAVGLGLVITCSSLLLPATVPQRPASSAGIAAVLPYRLPIVALWTMFLLGSAPALIAFGHAGQFARAPELSVLAVLLLNLGNFVGRLLAGPASDRFGYAPTLHLTAAVLLGACLTLAVADHPATALVALLALGLQYGAVSVLTPLAVSFSVPADRFGTAYGIVFSGWGLVGFVGPIAAAWMATRTGYPTVAGALIGVAVLFWGGIVWVTSLLRRTPGLGPVRR